MFPIITVVSNFNQDNNNFSFETNIHNNLLKLPKSLFTPACGYLDTSIKGSLEIK